MAPSPEPRDTAIVAPAPPPQRGSRRSGPVSPEGMQKRRTAHHSRPPSGKGKKEECGAVIGPSSFPVTVGVSGSARRGVAAASGSFDRLILTPLCVDRVKNLQTIAPRRQRSTTFASP